MLKALIIGQGTTGMAAAAMLIGRGWCVDAYDGRDGNSKRLAWGVRQPFLDAMARLDSGIADAVVAEGSSLSGGSVRIGWDGALVRKDKPGFRRPDPNRRLPESYEAMAEGDACFIVAASHVDAALKSWLLSNPRYRWRRARFIQNGTEPDEYSLIIHATGAGRTELRESALRSPTLRQASGVVDLPAEDEMRRGAYAFGTGRYNVAAIRRPGKNSYWMVCDVPAEAPAEVAFEAAAQALFRDRNDLPVCRGPLRGSSSPREFDFVQSLTTRSHRGERSVLIGDAVGNGHWLEGGGAQVGVVLHLQALSALADRGPTAAALREYSRFVQAASWGWIQGGLGYSYGVFDQLDALAAT